jgi:hypothetical protein
MYRNFHWVFKQSARRKRKRWVSESVVGTSNGSVVVNANRYVTQMLAVSIGLKLCDTTRRILLYTKGYHANKTFFAICRGIFPIHELTGTMTALGLARRDILGQYMPLWKLLAPAVVIHGMANFRGMKVRVVSCFLVCCHSTWGACAKQMQSMMFGCSRSSSGIRQRLGQKCNCFQ